ncbi:MAG: hypothetical protein IJH88_01435 [Eggerthellaceae bacterium]|nr:hypothetical protein [Eggerthellaceae bacterium]
MKTILRSPVFTVAIFVLAAALLGFGTVGAVQAAPRVQSGDFRAEVVLTNIETALTENGTVREGNDDLLKTFLADNGDSELKIGKTYPYKLGVRNVADAKSGGIPQHVRVTVHKFWSLTDADGNPLTHDGSKQGKAFSLDPSLIELHFVEGNGWTIDKNASTDERTVLYYSGVLEPGQDTPDFTDTLTINGKVVTDMTRLADGSDQFSYEGVQFRIKATVDAVQTHNGEAALNGAWGQHKYVNVED